MKLNHTLINSFKPQEKPYKKPDGNGLIMIINPNGSKWWRFNFRYEGKQKTLSMGVYPDVGLADARDKVHEARKLLAQDIDPSSLRKEKRVKSLGLNSFETIANRWHDEMMADGEWSEKHAKTVMTSLKRNVFPYVGNTDVSEILPTDLKTVFDRMADRGTTELLKRVKQRCSLVFNFAIGEGLINGNPTTGIRIRKHQAQNYHHITHKEIPELITAIENGDLEPTTRTGLMIALLTFQRTNEIRYATWDEIDFNAATWTIPAHRMKMKREHVIPLSKQALQLFKELQPITGDYPFIFASYHKPMKQPFSNNAMLFALYRLGFRGRMTVHGFRHLASTTLNELGFDSRHIEKQLSHEDSNTIRGTYNKAEYITERTKMMQQWSDFVLNKGGKIIPINRVN